MGAAAPETAPFRTASEVNRILFCRQVFIYEILLVNYVDRARMRHIELHCTAQSMQRRESAETTGNRTRVDSWTCTLIMMLMPRLMNGLLKSITFSLSAMIVSGAIARSASYNMSIDHTTALHTTTSWRAIIYSVNCGLDYIHNMDNLYYHGVRGRAALF